MAVELTRDDSQLVAKFPFEDYQYMGNKSNADYTWYGFKEVAGTGWYVMRKDLDNEAAWQYAYSTVDTGKTWTTAWADPTDLTFSDPPDS